jgi:hypothetical protein
MDLISFAAVTYIMEMQLRRDMLRKGKDMHHITMPMNIRTARSAEGGHVPAKCTLSATRVTAVDQLLIQSDFPQFGRTRTCLPSAMLIQICRN